MASRRKAEPAHNGAHVLERRANSTATGQTVNNSSGQAAALREVLVGNLDSTDAMPYLYRANLLQSLIDPRRDLDGECGYPPVILPRQFRMMYDREGVATRVVSIYPDECWAVQPDIFEDESDETSTFEAAWDSMLEHPTANPLHYLHRADVLSGIGRYGILFLGLDDDLGDDLEAPLPHLDEDGNPTGKGKDLKLNYMRPFDESMAQVAVYQSDRRSPRFGQPVKYNCIFADTGPFGPGTLSAASGITAINKLVHWSRVIHFADNRDVGGEVFGTPRQQPVFNRLCDVRKILGGSAEMFWKGGFPGYSLELNPELALAGAGINVNQDTIRQQMDRYMNGLQRYFSLVGLTAKSLAPQVADPEKSLLVQLQAIALTIGVPLRVFMGAEQAQLASGQDVRTWNRRLMKRHNTYLTPMVIRPFVDRLIVLGCLPKPDGWPKQSYKVRWPDINVPSAEENAKNSDRVAAACMKYILGGVWQMIPPYQFMTMHLGMTDNAARECIKSAKNPPADLKLDIIVPTKAGADGVGGAGNEGMGGDTRQG